MTPYLTTEITLHLRLNTRKENFTAEQQDGRGLLVDGVTKVDVDFDKRQAVVSYDDAKTNVGALTKATTNAGYPATLKQ